MRNRQMIFYVRNLSQAASEPDVRRAFEPIGPVASVTLLTDEANGTPLGVAVVDMPETHEHQVLNNALVGVQIDGSEIRVGPPRGSADRRSGRDRRSPGRESTERRGADRRVIKLSDYR